MKLSKYVSNWGTTSRDGRTGGRIKIDSLPDASNRDLIIDEIDISVIQARFGNPAIDSLVIEFAGNSSTPLSFDKISFEKTTNKSIYINIVFKHCKIMQSINCRKRNIAYSLSFYDSTFVDSVDFSESTFGSWVNFLDSKFGGEVYFSNSTFGGKANFSRSTFVGEAYFSESTFVGEAYFSESTFVGEAYFSESKFGGEAYFSESIFEGEVYFKNTECKEVVNFSNSTFEKDVYFHRAIFRESFQIYRSQFFKVANFYYATFENVPNFSAVIFKEPLATNFVGTDVRKLNFEKLEKYIKNMANEEAKESDPKEEIKRKVQHAENSKDSFATIKHNLIAKNNLLEANKYRLLELYAEELKLKYELELKQKTQNEAQQESENTRSKASLWIEKLQHTFYRYTSNHHTDLLKIIKWFIVLLGYFAITLFFIRYGFDTESFLAKHGDNGLIDFIKDNAIFNFVYENKLLYFIIFWSYLLLIQPISRFVVGFIASFLLISISPKYIFGLATLISSPTNSFLENILISSYSLIAFLLLFSLQKTARKNSIIPS